MTTAYDALLVVSFGGPEGTEDVLPFLENVVRGKPVPRARLLEVAEHYYHFGGKSPINDQCRELIAALRGELDRAGIALPIYWGNRNWRPLLADTLRDMRDAGVRRALAYFTSAYSSYSSCRQYLENIAAAQAEVGPGAPAVDKLRAFYNHPEFIAAGAERIRAATAALPPAERAGAHLVFTAHSIPQSMADHCQYAAQLQETCRLLAAELSWPAERRRLVYQSRSGRPQDPWLEPDILTALRDLRGAGATAVVVAPIGFLSDHMEVLYDLDYEAQQVCAEIGLTMMRAGTVSSHPRFVAMIRELIAERLGLTDSRRALGQYGPSHDDCPAGCCLSLAPPLPPAVPPAN